MRSIGRDVWQTMSDARFYRHVASMFQAVKVDPKEGIAAAIARKKEQVSCSRAFVSDGINAQ